MASRRSSGANPPGNIASRARRIIWAALGMLPFCAAPISAQPAVADSPTLHGRIEAAAKMLQNNPRLKGLTEQQRIDRVEFVAANTLVLLLHELGHVHIAEMHLPVFGREEDAADTFAALTMLKIGTSFSQHELAQAAKGWFLNDLRDQQTGEKPLYYDEHNLNQQQIRRRRFKQCTAQICKAISHLWIGEDRVCFLVKPRNSSRRFLKYSRWVAWPGHEVWKRAEQ